MSKQVDDRVVSLQFDNKNFESNVSTTMSTLDKLKAKLSFKGAEKGLENISASVSKVNMSGLGSGVDAVQAKFSALQVVGVTALANITNSAVNAGKRMLSAFTIDPIRTGFNEYELKMGSVQTIMASTGASIQEVNKYLNELNEYSDRTIYSFADMTNNIGKFTNAGVKLEDAVVAIKGISNEAAVSGANANEASRAMYNLSQALSAGYVKLIDWKSIENANMATVEFKQQLIDSAVAMGTLTKRSDGMYQTLTGKTLNATHNFNDTLQEQWLTTDVLIGTLKDYADETTAIGKKAYGAAQDVKTFSMMMDTLKEAAQSGWAQSWEIIFGDFEQAKKLWTKLSEVLGNIIGKIDDARNKWLSKTFQEKSFDLGAWDKLEKKVNKSGVSIDKFKEELKATAKSHNVDVDSMITKHGDFTESLKENWLTGDMVIETLKRMSKSTKDAGQSQEDLTNKLKYFQEVVDKVWYGDYKNGQERIEALTKAGYDYYKVQELVNKTVDGHRLTLEDLGEKQLKAIGYTDAEIASLKKLAAQAEKSGSSLNELINELNRRTGRELLGESFEHLWEELQKIFDAIKKAWDDIFPEDEKGTTWLYSLISDFNDAVMDISANEQVIKNVTDTFKGLFSALDMGVWVLGGPLSILRKIIKVCLNLLQLDFLGLTARVGRMIVGFREWLTTNNELAKSLLKAGNAILDWVDKIVKGFVKVVNAIINLDSSEEGISKFTANCIKALKPLEAPLELIKNAFAKFGQAIDNLSEKKLLNAETIANALGSLARNIVSALVGLPETVWGVMKEVGRNIAEGLGIGVGDGIGDVLAKVQSFVSNVIQAFMSGFGVHSPSTVMIWIGSMLVAGLIAGISNNTGGISNVVNGIVKMIKNLFEGLDMADVVLIGTLGMVLYMVNKLINILGMLFKPAEKINKILGDLDVVLKAFGKNLEAKALKTKAEAFKVIAESILMLAGALIALSFVPSDKLKVAGIALAAIAAGLTVLFFAIKKIDIKEIPNLLGISGFLLSVGAAMILMSAAVRLVSGVKQEQLLSAITGFILIIGAVSAVMFAITKLDANNLKDSDKAIKQLGKLMTRIGLSMILMAAALRLVGGMDPSEAYQAAQIFTLIGVAIASFMALSKYTGDKCDKVALMIGKIASAMLVIGITMRIIGGMDSGAVIQSITVIGLIATMLGAFMYLSKYADPKVVLIGDMFLKLSASLAIIAIAIKMMGMLKANDIVKAIGVITACAGLFYVWTALCNTLEGYFTDPGNMFMKMSASMILLAVAIKLIAGLSLSDVAYGFMVIGAFSIFFKALIKVSKDAGANAAKAGVMLMGVAVAIGILAIVLRLLRGLEIEDIAKGLVFIGGLYIFIRGLIKVSKYAGENADKAGIMLMKLAVPIAVLAAAIGLLSLLDPKNVAVASAGLAAVIGIFSYLIKAVPTGEISNNLMKSLLALSLAIGVIGFIVYKIGGLPWQGTLAACAGLSLVFIAMSAMLKVIGTICTISKNAYIGLAAVTGVVAALAVILGILSALKVTLSIETAVSLSIMLMTMSAVFAILAYIGPVSKAAVAGAVSLIEVIGILGGVLIAIGALMTYIPQVEQFLDKGVNILNKLGSAIGSFVGSMIAGFTDAAKLPETAQILSDFMAKAQPFFDAVNGLNTDSLGKINDFIAAMNSLSEYTGGQVDFEAFKADMDALGDTLIAYSNKVSGETFNVEAIKASAQAAQAIVNMTNSIGNTGGYWGKFAGDNDLGEFATDLSAFADAISVYNEKVTAESFNVEAITSSAQAAQAIVDMANSIDKTGGAWSYVFGDKDLGKFATGLEQFADAITKYNEKVTSEDFNVEQIINSMNAAQAIVDMANSIGREDRRWYDMFLDTDLESFAGGLEAFAGALVAYNNKIADSGINCEAIETSAKAANALVTLGNGTIPSGDTLENFGGHLEGFGESLKTYSEKIVDVDFEKVKASAGPITALKDAFIGLQGLKSDGAKALKESVNALKGLDIKGMLNSFEGVNSDKISNLSKVGSKLGSSLSSGISGSMDSVTKAMKSVVNSAKNAANDKAASFKDVGKAYSKNIGSGIKNNESKATKAAKSVGSSAASKAKDAYSDFYSAGKYLVEGFAAGISANTYLAIAKSVAMADAAEQAARDALDINSPSKVFRRIGMAVPEGFAQGIGKLGHLVTGSAERMADTAINATSKAMSRIAYAIDTDVDTQPTIRPVVDLTDVASGVSMMNGMLSMQPSVGLMANVNGVSASMNRLIQNGGNDDVISAINGLKKTIADSNGNTFNVNGITYDDGSNVADAVKALVRAAKIERRS